MNLITQLDPITGRGRYYIIKVTKGDIINKNTTKNSKLKNSIFTFSQQAQ